MLQNTTDGEHDFWYTLYIVNIDYEKYGKMSTVSKVG